MTLTLTVILIVHINAAFAQASGKNLDWIVFGGDTSHTGFKNVRLEVSSSKLLWNSTIKPYTYATVSNDYYMTMASGGATLLNATTGNPIYTIPIQNTYFNPSTPIFAFDTEITEYVGSSSLSVNAYSNGNDGNGFHQIWSFQRSIQISWNQYGVTPSDTQNIIYIPGGYQNTNMYAVNATDGELIFTTYWGSYGCDRWTPTVYQGRVFINNCNGGNPTFFAEVNSTGDGKILWQIDLNTPISWYTQNWVPSISNNVAVVRSNRTNYSSNGIYQNSAIAAIDINKHKILWTRPCQESPQISNIALLVDYSVATDDKYAYVSCNDVGVKSFELYSGKPGNIYSCRQDNDDVCIGQPLITENTVIVNSMKGVKIFNKRTGRLIKQLSVPGMPALIVSKKQKILYINHQNGSWEGGIYAYSFK